MRYLLIVAGLVMLGVVAGGIVGWHLHPEPLWDIGKDERACIIQWDDGTVSYKSRSINIGDLQPGESKAINIAVLPSSVPGRAEEGEGLK